MGSVPMHNIIPRLSETPGRFFRPAPEMGQDNAEIFGALGIDPVALDDLTERGII